MYRHRGHHVTWLFLGQGYSLAVLNTLRSRYNLVVSHAEKPFMTLCEVPNPRFVCDYSQGKLCALDIHFGLVTSPFKGCPMYLSTALLKILPEIGRCTQNMILQLSQWEKIWNASRICVSSLRRGHANLLCIVPILVYVLPLSEHVYRAYRAQYILDSIVRRWTLWDLLGLGA